MASKQSQRSAGKSRNRSKREIGEAPREPRRAPVDLLDPTEMLLAAIAKGIDAGYAEIDDREIPKAKNAVEWLTSPEFLGIKPYAKQIQDAIHIFTAACYFCSDSKYLVDIPVDDKLSNILDRTTLMERGKCPRCSRRVAEMRYEWCLDPANTFNGYIKPEPPNSCCMIEGQRSGKSTKTAMYATWVLHRYLMLANPTKYFGLLEAVGALHGTFVSVTAKQAWENLWQPFSDLVDSSPWFKRYHKWLDDKGRQLGISLYHKPDTYLWYGHKRLALSFAPADQRTLRGRTRMLAGVDELGWFGASRDRSGTTRMRADGDGTVRALDRSLSTIRNAAHKRRKLRQNCPDGYMFTISSPSSATDPIMRRYATSPKSPRMYSVLRATWESNPTFTEFSLREQEGDVLERDFLCVDPSTLVSTSNGLQRIGDLCPQQGLHQVNDLFVNSHRGLFQASHVLRNRHSQTLEVETKHGLKVVCTPDQKFLTVSEDLKTRWVPANRLTKGTHLVVANKVTWPKAPPTWKFSQKYGPNQKRTRIPKKMSRTLARFLGYHASEGSLSRCNYQLKFGMTDKETALDYLSLFNRLFRLKKVLSPEWHSLSTKYSYEVDLTRKDVYDWLCSIGAQGNSHTKQVPWVILQSPQEFVVEFLRGLFEGDGSIWLAVGNSPVITLELASETLLRQTQVLLLQLNILGALNRSKGGHRLVISGVNRDRFIKKIGFISKQKRKHGVTGATKQHSLTLNIPNLSRNWSDARTSKIKMHRLCELGDNYLDQLEPALRKKIDTLKGYVTSPVRHVVQGPIVETCDFSVPKSKRFFGNGLVVHNCDFACRPPYSDDPWWDNETGLLDVCAKKDTRLGTKDTRLWTGSAAVSKDPTSGKSRFVYYKFTSITGDMVLPRCLCFDNGEKHNSFAWATGRYDKQHDTVIVEEVGEVAPGDNERIHHGLMWENVIEPLVQRFRFLNVGWDRWESTRYVADLRTKYRIRAEQYSPTMKDGKTLKSDIANSKILLPMPEMPVAQLPIDDPVALARTPRSHLLFQALTSRDGNGLPLKSQGGNDDLLRAVLLLDRFIRDNVEDYGRYNYYGGSRCVGIGVGGAVAGGMGRGQGLVVGHGGRALGVGVRR